MVDKLLDWSTKAVLYLAAYTIYFSLIGSYLLIVYAYWPYSLSIIILTISVLYCYYRYWKHCKEKLYD